MCISSTNGCFSVCVCVYFEQFNNELIQKKTDNKEEKKKQQQKQKQIHAPITTTNGKSN